MSKREVNDEKKLGISPGQIPLPSPNNDLKNFRISISDNGRVNICKKAWCLRISMLVIVSFFPAYRLYQGVKFNDPFIIYSTLIPSITILILIGSWYWYKNPAKGTTMTETDLVSVIIPIYNQKKMIKTVIDAVYRSKYRTIEVIAVNDGSIDGTKEILDDLKKRYPVLQVIHQKRGGKRKACATGFYASKGNFIIHMDSDSVIDEDAITEIMKAFMANPKVGAVVGELRIWNANNSLLTKMQEAWHNISCNINKAYESSFGSVTCCSGPLSGFRREVISNFMPYWSDSNKLSGGGIDRELTAYVMAPKNVKKDLVQTLWTPLNLTHKLMESATHYDDADDRLLTAQSLEKWESAYVVTATTYVEGQETWKGFIKQQTRWRKGFLRANFYLATFFWKERHPLASVVYYLEVMAGLTIPFVIVTVLLYEPLVLEQFWLPFAFIGGIIFSAVVQGIDMKLRCPKSRIWKYMPLMSLFGTFVLSWLLFAALWNFRKNSWMTR